MSLRPGCRVAHAKFGELLDDVSATVSRPLLSVSTDATMIDEAWAERIVRAPFKSMTISIDGGTVETFDRLRWGRRRSSDRAPGGPRRFTACRFHLELNGSGCILANASWPCRIEAVQAISMEE